MKGDAKQNGTIKTEELVCLGYHLTRVECLTSSRHTQLIPMKKNKTVGLFKSKICTDKVGKQFDGDQNLLRSIITMRVLSRSDHSSNLG